MASSVPEETPIGRAVARPLLHKLLCHRHLPWVLAAAAVVFTLPSLWAGLELDDYVQRLKLTDSPTAQATGLDISSSPFAIFTFLDGNVARNRALMDVGVAPWWTLPDLKASFMRPLTALTHSLDYLLWPDTPVLMHLQSVVWYAALAAAAVLLYRRLVDSRLVAGLAALLFVLDHAHGTIVGWLAARNAIIAVFLGVVCLLGHDRWRRDGWRAGAAVAPILLALSLLAGEAGIATGVYLVAYALVLDRATWRRRFATLLPYVIVIIAWRGIWSAAGFGVHGLGDYADPIGEPSRFLTAVAERGPVLFLAQWFLPPSEIYYVLTSVGSWLGTAQWGLAIAVLAIVGWALAPLLRRDPVARFWTLGMVGCIALVCSSVPTDRLLGFAGLGAMGLIASLAAPALDRISAPRLTARRLTKPRMALAVVLLATHGLLAPIALPVRAAMPNGPKSLTAWLYADPPLDDSVANQHVILVNAPSAIHAGYLPILRANRGEPIPKQTLAICPSFSDVRLVRTDKNTIKVTPTDGFLGTRLDRLFRAESFPMQAGQTIELTGVAVEIDAVSPHGRPTIVSYRFDAPLEDSRYRWLLWSDGDYVPFEPPGIGEAVELRGVSLDQSKS